MLRPWEFQIVIHTDGAKAVYLQIADAIIEAIKGGKLQSNNALPGSRLLASQLKVNRNTVIQALDILLAEGWLISRERKGTFVSDTLPNIKTGITKAGSITVSEGESGKPARIVFDDGLPDSRLAPINELARAYRQIFSRKGRWQMMGYSSESGDIEFRNAIVQMLNFKRGMQLAVNNVFITRGSQMAMYLTAKSLFERGDDVVVENPGYQPAWETLKNAGANLIPIAVDAEGLNIAMLKATLNTNPNIKAVYITPHHQFPTTVTLSLARRLELVALSNRFGFTIIEDDYDNEFHFGQRPVMPVCSLGNIENYVYIGTMSKIVAPALRIGYLATDAKNIEKISKLRKMIDVQGDNIMEQAVLQLINDGEIKRHLKRATAKYRNKRDFFEKLIITHLQEKVNYVKPEGGLAFWLVPKKATNLSKLAADLAKQGIQIMPPDKFGSDIPVQGLRLGYASLSEKQLEEGIMAIAALL
ncbi:HTH-type transcriptional regulatory protein GabR [compost metagenome]